MKGALWQDGDHLPDSPWNRGATRGHSGWTEIHPVDWIVRVDEPKPAYQKTVKRLPALLVEENRSEDFFIDLYPPNVRGNPETRKYAVGEIRDLIDARFTDMSTVSRYSVVNKIDHVDVNVTLSGTATSQGRFKCSYIVTWRETDSGDVVWVNDAVPAGATLAGGEDGWTWVNVHANPAPFSGMFAHQSNDVMGMHQHYFFGATNQLEVQAGDTLFACVYLDPTSIPYEVMLQWNDGTWEHRAYWGANLIEWGTDGTASRRYMGPISMVGQWVRLEVPAGLVGLGGRTINGMAFTLFGGRATWDYAGKVPAPPVPIWPETPTPEEIEEKDRFGSWRMK